MRYDACLNRILSRAPGCPDEVAIDALRDAAIEWCRGTYMLTAAQSVTSVGATLTPAPGSGLEVIDVPSILIADQSAPVLPLNSPEIDLASADCPACTFTGWPGVLTIHPAPSANVVASVVVVTCPTADAEEMPDALWSRHREALIAGAVARVLTDEGVPWAKPGLGDAMRARFDDELSKHAGLYGRNRFTTARRLRVKPA